MIKVLMLGWEFPPYFAGGVGMVCYEIAKAFSKRDDINVTYVMPYGPDNLEPPINIIIAHNVISNKKIKTIKIPSLVGAYITEEQYKKQRKKLEMSKLKISKDNTSKLYGNTLLEDVMMFREKLRLLVKDVEFDNVGFDIIHAHDWTTFPAAIAVKEETGKPLIIHVHITEFNKSGGSGVNPYIYEIERYAMKKADKIITVSNLMKNICVKNYDIDPNKIEVIHNGPITMKSYGSDDNFEIKKNNNIVLFAGRVTLQKGPEYFIKAASRVQQVKDKLGIGNIKFVMAGTGDQLQQMISLAIKQGIINDFIFHGFYTREDAEKLFSIADVFVMPSVLEPFGVVPFEAMYKNTPIIISKQSGCAEVIKHALKVDFWDIDEMANQIISLLKYKELHNTLRKNGMREVKSLSWDQPIEKIVKLYKTLVKYNTLVNY